MTSHIHPSIHPFIHHSLAHSLVHSLVRSLAHSLVHDPTTWDSFLSKLTAPPAQYATQLPAPHTPQPPAPAHSLNQPLTLAEVEVGCTMAGQEPCTATPRSCCVMPSLWPHQMTQRQLTYWHLAFWCYSMLPSAQGRCPNPGRLP